MNLRYLASTALAMAVATLSFPAAAELVVNSQAPVANSAQVAGSPVAGTAQAGVIEFSSRPSNTIVRPAGTSSRPSGNSLNWNTWSSAGTSQGGLQTVTVDRADSVVVQSTSPSATSRQVIVSDEGRVTEVGREKVSASDIAVPVRGWAEQVPLEMALSQVIPGDWSIQARGVDLKRLASWRGNKPWVEVLSDLTRQGKFNANVVWDRKVVVVFPVGALDGTALAPLASSKVAIVEPVVVAPVVATAKTWKIDPKLTLRGNVEAWAKQAGWNTVVWEAADYPIVAPAVLEGEFASPTGPLAKLIDAYRDSDQPLEVSLSTMDKVVHVTNKNFDAPTVAPLTPQQVVPHVFEK